MARPRARVRSRAVFRRRAGRFSISAETVRRVPARYCGVRLHGLSPESHSRRAVSGPCRGRRTHVGDLDHLARERDDVGGVADEVNRRRLVQAFDDRREGAVLLDPQERSAVVRCRRPRVLGIVLGRSQYAARERAYNWWPRPNSTSTIKGAPEATSVAVVDFAVKFTTLPVAGTCGTGPASPM